MTAFVRETGDSAYDETAKRLWTDVTTRKMHISGGAGPIHVYEGFSYGYFLPNSGYLETCAGIALAFWAHQMGLREAKSEYADVAERVLYNIALGGVDLTGTNYAYRNPLQGDGELRRWEWHQCPCCPPMLMKLTSSIPTMTYSVGEGRLVVNHYVAGEARVVLDGQEVRIVQATDYPRDGRVAIRVKTEDPFEFELDCRVPGWCDEWTASIDGESIDQSMVADGYLRIRRKWSDETLELDLVMKPIRFEANPSVHECRGKIAVQRGPLLYCFEAQDNKSRSDITIGMDPSFAERIEAELADDVVAVEVDAADGSRLTAIPFYARGNRGDGPDEFEVWVEQEGARADNSSGVPDWLDRPYEPV